MTKLLLRWFVKDYKNVQDPAVRRRYGTMGGVVGILWDDELNACYGGRF